MAARYVNSRLSGVAPRPAVPSAIAQLVGGGIRDGGFAQATPANPAAKAAKMRAGFNPQQEAAFKQFTGAVGKASGPSVQGNQPGWEDMVGWDEQRREIDMSFQGGMAQNEQAMNAWNQQKGIQDYGFNKEWDRAGTGIGYSDNRRGMLQSGVNRDHWKQFGMDRSLALRQMLMNQQGQYDQLVGERGDLERRRGSGLAGVAQSEQWRRAQLAQLIGGK